MSYKVRFFDPSKGYLRIKEEILREVDRVLMAGDLILRADVERFEENLADFVGAKYAIGLNSGTDALLLALKALGVGPGDEVITSSHTFVATIQIIPQLGAEPILVDINDDGLMDKRQVVENLTEKTKAIIPVHLTGSICDMKKIVDGYPYIVADSAQALGAKGIMEKIQCFSFYPAKILGAYGDAGAITTNDEELYREIHKLRNHYNVKATGLAGSSKVEKFGYNSRLDNLQAAILNVKFKYLPEILAKRKEIAERYLEELRELEYQGFIKLPNNQVGRSWQDFIVRVLE